MKKLAMLLASVMAFSMVLTACGGSASSSTATSAAGSASASAAEVSGPKEVSVNLASEPPEMNSITTTSTGSMNVLRHIMDGLVMLDQKDTPIPAVAEKWDISEDGLTYTFHLRSDVKWSNGDTVTAKDFVFAWNQLFTAETAAPYASTWAALVKGAEDMLNNGVSAEGIGYEAVDDTTLTLTLARPCTYILSVLAFPNFYPMNEKAYTEMGGIDGYGTEAELFCTNGAFKIESWEHENELVMVKNADYYAADTIALDKISMAMISDTTTAYNSFVAGDLDMIGLSGDQSVQATNEGYEVQSYDDGSCWYFEFNCVQPGLNNAKVRQALTYAVDAESFVKNIVKNNSTIAYSFTPPAINGGAFTEKVGKLMDREGYAADDYAKAKALLEEGLAEEGMKVSDLKIAIVTDEGDTAAKNCAFFQEQWKSHLGVEATVEQMTYKARLQRMNAHEFSVVLAGWGPDYNDPMTFMDLWITGGGNNHAGYANADYDALIEAAANDGNADTRTATLVEAEKLLMNEMPIGPIYNRKRDFVTSDRVTGIVRTGFDDLNLRWADVVA